MSSSNSPCAACKTLRRKCTQECVFAPFFPPDQTEKLINVHNVFGAKNVAQILIELHPPERKDAVNSLAYEAKCRLRDPVYGCIGLIYNLQQKLKQVENDIMNVKKEWSAYVGPFALLPLFQHIGLVKQHPNNNPMQHNMQSTMISPLKFTHQQQQQLFDALHFAAVPEQNENFRIYGLEKAPQPQQKELVRLCNKLDGGPMSKSSFLGSYEPAPYHHATQPQQEQSLSLQNDNHDFHLPQSMF